MTEVPTRQGDNKLPLAIHGGEKTRSTPMPPRLAIGENERAMVQKVLDYYAARNADPGYEGVFEKQYTSLFANMMGGGFADAVSTGTAALYIAVAALELPKGSEVLVSPITDPGTLSAIILNNLVPRLMDTKPSEFVVGPEQFAARLGPEVKGAVIVHSFGQAAEIDKIVVIAHENGIKVVEDCAQAHFAKHRAKPVGTFGDIAAFSTMYRKAHTSGPSGGIVYSRDEATFHKALIYADRGKPRWRDDFDDRDPSTYLAPALNHNTDEISCAIGTSSLRRLPQTIISRLAFVSDLVSRFEGANICKPFRFMPANSPFVHPMMVDRDAITCSKIEFAEAVRAEGIDLNTHYKYLVADWPYMRPYLADGFDPPNARAVRDSTFILYLNEKYGEQEAKDVVKAVKKVERHFKKA